MRDGLVYFFLLITLGLNAQERCGSIAPSDGSFETWMKEKMLTKKLTQSNNFKAPVYQIPIVVHVFHKGEPIGSGVNLSEERILAQIDSLNADFRRLNADTINTPMIFRPIAADVEINFVLAKQDPDGNPTNGIVRLQGSRNTYRSNSHRPLLRSESFWPATNYLNVYVVDLQVFLGYASFPLISLEGNKNEKEDYIFDGVLVDYEYFGVNPSAPSFQSFGRTLTHEIGHYLGLRHIWGDGNCSIDDFVDDTPLADDDNGNYTSPCTFPNPNDSRVCESGEPEMFQNYMDYTDDICMNLFTEGQKTRMRIVMENAQNRPSLTTSPGLIEPNRFLDDLAITEILDPNFALCETGTLPQVVVTNYGTNEVTSYDIQLLIDGNHVGSPERITTILLPLESDTVAFDMQTVTALTSITFEITGVNENTDGNISNNSFSRIVSNTSSNDLPFIENFEDLPGVLGNYGNNQPWEIVNAPKDVSTNQAMVFKSHNNTQWFGENTILKTPIMDLTGISAGDLLFSYAHANVSEEFYDGLMVKASVDCGETFPDIIFSSFGTDLSTAGESDTYFTPANQLEWVDTLISITEYRDIDGVQFAFVGLNGSGNNIYLDDIQVQEANLFENDIKPISLEAPLLTCSQSSNLRLVIRNNGFQDISSFEVEYFINGDTNTVSFEDLSIPSRDFSSFSLPVNNLTEGDNLFGAEVIRVNDAPDGSVGDNSIDVVLIKDNVADEYPLTVDFETTDPWTITSNQGEPLFERTSIKNNGLLEAKGFDVNELGIKSWFVSPKLNTGNLDSAKLYFRASYAARDGFEDRLEVLMSVDCGENFNTILLNADSDSLKVTTISNEWTSPNQIQWKSYELDLSRSFFFEEEIRIAFVFTPGGGNNLFIDDISIREGDIPSYQDIVRIYPNPATFRFNVGLNLPQKEPVTIRFVDISGKIVFEDYIENAFNQVIEYKAPSQEGLYFLTIIGDQFSTSQKLFISR
ncbi:MAG: choice-of-anchor J domain-containing protein [Bacteroidota bacterium]